MNQNETKMKKGKNCKMTPSLTISFFFYIFFLFFLYYNLNNYELTNHAYNKQTNKQTNKKKKAF